MPSGGSRCATGRDDKVPLIVNKVPAWLPPSAIKRDALTTNSDFDDEEIFRKVRGLLNKLTPEKFDKLSAEFCSLLINSAKVVKGVIHLILDKALCEPAYSALYAQLCQKLDKCVVNFEPPNTPINTFRKLLLTVCQHEFDNRSNYFPKSASNSDDNKNSDANRNDSDEKSLLEVAKQNAKKKMLGNVKFIGELGRLDLLSEAILHKCIRILLEKQRDEKYSEMSEDLECLCKMMPSIGKKLDQGESIKLMDQYFERMRKLRNIGTIGKQGNATDTNKDTCLPTRIKFLLQDCIDLRANNWVPRQTQLDQAPKTMTEVRNGAFMEEMAAAAAIASSKEAQEAAAAASYNISSSYLHQNMSGRSAIMMNVYQTLSQQPNMSLLNAITGISVQKNFNKKFNQNDLGCYRDLRDAESYDYVNKSESKPMENNLIESNQSKYPQRITKFNSSKVGYDDQIQTINSNENKPKAIKPVDLKFETNNSTDNLQTKPTSKVYPNSTSMKLETHEHTNYKITSLSLKNDTNSFNFNNSGVDTPLSTAAIVSEPLNLAQIVNKKTVKNPETETNKAKSDLNPDSGKDLNWHNKKFLKNNYSSHSNNIQNEEYLNLNSGSLSIIHNNNNNNNITNNNYMNMNNQHNTNGFNTQFYQNSKNYRNANNKNNLIDESDATRSFKKKSPNFLNRTLTMNKIETEHETPHNPGILENSNNFFKLENRSTNGFANNHHHHHHNNNNNINGNIGQQRTNNTLKTALGVSKDDVLPLNKQIIPLEKVIKHDYKHAKPKNNQLLTQSNPNPVLQPNQTSNYQVLKGNLPNCLINQTDSLINSTKSSQNHKAQTNETNTKNHLTEEVKKKIITLISGFLDAINSDDTIKPETDYLNDNEQTKALANQTKDLFRDLKFTNEQLSESVRVIITYSLSKSDFDRLNISKLFAQFHKNDKHVITTDVFLNGFKVVLNNLNNLETEFHFVKSYISLYAARSIYDNIISFGDLAHLMKNGAFYPLFFLCMQNLHKLKSPEWLRVQLERFKINLIEMLPTGDKNKERLVQILEDRELEFVYPMLKIESLIFEKIQSNLSNKELNEWIDITVSSDIRSSNDFIQSLVTCIVKNAAEKSVLSNDISLDKMNKNNINNQKQLIQKYQNILQDYLKKSLSKQIEAIYAMQVYASSKGFPKYFLAHLFNQMYDLEIIEEEAFFRWKDEINENYPNKGQALFYLQRWFNWLEEASEESSESEKEDGGNKIDYPKKLDIEI